MLVIASTGFARCPWVTYDVVLDPRLESWIAPCLGSDCTLARWPSSSVKSDHILAKLVRSQVTWCQVQEMLARIEESLAKTEPGPVSSSRLPLRNEVTSAKRLREEHSQLVRTASVPVEEDRDCGSASGRAACCEVEGVTRPPPDEVPVGRDAALKRSRGSLTGS